MTSVEKLLSIASDPLAPTPEAMPDLLQTYTLGAELFDMLRKKNGYYAFESALHVYPLAIDSDSGLIAWNGESLWRSGYGTLAKGLLFFAEDVLQDQFCLSRKHSGVWRFCAETGQAEFIADSIEAWASVILSNYRRETGWPFVHEWQEKNGPLPAGKRLMPKKPFFLGGEYNLENFWAGNALEGMRFKADLAVQTMSLPEGAQVKLNIAPK